MISIIKRQLRDHCNYRKKAPVKESCMKKGKLDKCWRSVLYIQYYYTVSIIHTELLYSLYSIIQGRQLKCQVERHTMSYSVISIVSHIVLYSDMLCECHTMSPKLFPTLCHMNKKQSVHFYLYFQAVHVIQIRTECGGPD